MRWNIYISWINWKERWEQERGFGRHVTHARIALRSSS